MNVFGNRSSITPREGEKELSYISFTQQTEKNEGGKKEQKEEKNSNRLQLGMSGLRLKRERAQNKKENMREGGEV